MGAPIFHVNGDDVEAVVRAMQLAIDFRQTFGKDVVIDVVCYRRHGHQESDNPMFTQPEMYSRIKKKIPALDLYTEQLVSEGVVEMEEVEKMRSDEADRLEQKQKLAATYVPTEGEWLMDESAPEPPNRWRYADGRWQSCLDGSTWPLTTGVDAETLRELTRVITDLPAWLTPHRVVKALYKQRSTICLLYTSPSPRD